MGFPATRLHKARVLGQPIVIELLDGLPSSTLYNIIPRGTGVAEDLVVENHILT